jgi:hypothetical protein
MSARETVSGPGFCTASPRRIVPTLAKGTVMITLASWFGLGLSPASLIAKSLVENVYR